MPTQTLAPTLADHLAGLTLDLCRIPSVTGEEADLCADIASRCATLIGVGGVKRLGNSVVCTLPPRAGRPTIGLFGHLDTVKPDARQPVEVREGRVYGCGASDMKGGLAVMLALLERSEDIAGANLVCVFYDKEEGPYVDNGLDPVLEGGLLPPMDLAICMEPTDNRIQAGCVGNLQALVTFRGRRAHSARPWQGENAIYKAIPALERLRDFGRREVVRGGLLFYEVMNATQATTSNSRNVIPDALVLNVNYRFAPGKAIARAKEELLSLIGPEAEVEVVDEAPAADVATDHPLVAPWCERFGLSIEPKQAWTDVARLSARGIPALNFGPGETAQAHQANESVPVSYLVESYEALWGLLNP